MKPLLITTGLLLIQAICFSQYYLRGDLKDEQGQGLQGARIFLRSNGNYPYYTGSSGAFGIPSHLKVDTIQFTLNGYDTLRTAVITSQVRSFVLKMTNRKANTSALHLFSSTKNFNQSIWETANNDGESYSSTIENQFVNTNSYPETAFALHVDRASYSNVRRFLTSKEKPPVDAVRIEEMLNYFNFKTGGSVDQQKAFSINTHLTSCPWNPASQLFFINLHAKKISLDKTPPANLVFLIDVSGSMDMPNRLPLVKNAFKLLVEHLRSKDVVSIVTYGDKVTLLLESTSGDKKQKIIEALEELAPLGATPGASAIRTAYNIARNNFIQNGNNRVVLATDGDFNVGQSSEKELENIISQESKTGINLTCLGVGMGNYKDSKLEALAKRGNGNFAYLDNEKEAEKVLVEEFAQTMYTVATDVYLNVKFNKEAVKEYRLIGFDNKKSAIADNKAAIEGGDIGSGHCLLAAFEITGAAQLKESDLIKVANLEVSYKLPGNGESIILEEQAAPHFSNLNKADSSLKFAAAVIMFGTFLKESEFAKESSWEDLNSLALSAANSSNLLQKEFIELVSKAKKLYPERKRKSLARR